MRIALGLEYNGAAYFGWQRQRDMPTIQGELEAALTKIASHPVAVTCAGRTDAGVHASCQVVHFDVQVERSASAWTLGVNSHLPKDIAVRWAQVVDESFNARFSATARRYRYVIYSAPTRPALLADGVTHVYHPLDVERMQSAAPALLGEHDFTSFRAAHCQSNRPFRNVHQLKVHRRGPYVVVEIMANAFLHHMVRNIVGSLIVIGQGERPVEWLGELLAAQDRKLAAATAKPNGLYLVDVTYPDSFGLPRLPLGPIWAEE